VKHALLVALLVGGVAAGTATARAQNDEEHIDIQADDGSTMSYECVHVSSSLGGQDWVEPEAQGYTIQVVLQANDLHPVEFLLCKISQQP
jgi:hypothetical protein